MALPTGRAGGPTDLSRSASQPEALIPSAVTIYHGTPMTPRAALNAVLPGRGGCISFYRPDDLEAVLAVCPQVMFRPRGVQLLDGGNARREGMGRGRPSSLVVSLLRLAGTDPVHAGTMGDHARQSSGAIPAQRRVAQRLALRGSGRACLAYGRADRAAGKTVRPALTGLHRLDRRPEAGTSGMRRLPSQDGRGCSVDGQPVAPAAYAARNSRRMGLPLYQRGQHVSGAERTPL